MYTAIRALQSPEAQALIASGLNLVSTSRQLQNGTIALAGRVNKQPVSFKITATGAVLSNEFVARQAFGETPYAQYKEALAQAGELLAKRVG